MTDDPQLSALLEFLKSQRGFDFTGYKRASLERRLAKRLEATGCADYAAYQEHLELHTDEFGTLFDTILINVTAFFRDPAAWACVEEQVLPALLASRPAGPIRVWSAGCATGEEAYTLAMLLVGHMGEADFRDRVKIYATDVDEDALTGARLARYPSDALADAPPELVERCFERVDGSLAFRKDLRRAVIFGRNDLVQDAPISRLDLLMCRNTLMYFTAEAQHRILTRFNFALHDDGYLFLGRSETLLTQSELFRPVDLRCRVFRKAPRKAPPERSTIVADGDLVNRVDAGDPLRDGAFDASPLAQIVVDRAGVLRLANQQARGLFGLTSSDAGRPVQDLEVSYRPVELRSAIEQAYSERRAIAVTSTQWRPPSGDERRLDVAVTPLVTEDGAILGAGITFADVTGHRALTDELDRSQRELESAYEELQSTVEELETTNEELQSTNEELETTNEELQSTNEELETLNEELQSTNQELETINDELRERSIDLDQLNAALEAIVASLHVAVVVVDDKAVVQTWNGLADDLWGLRADEAVGRHLFGLDIGLPVEAVRKPLRTALAGEVPAPLVLEATNRRGQTIRCKVATLPLVTDGRDMRGAVLLMEDERPG